MAAAGVIVLGLAGCGGPVPVRLMTWDGPGAVTEPNEEVREILDEAFGFWELGYELSDGNAYGRLAIDIVDVEHDAFVHGRRWDAGRCRQFIWISRRRPMLVHEVGHAFGLTHGDADGDPDHIMAPSDPGLEVTSGQIERVKDDAYRFTGCRP